MQGYRAHGVPSGNDVEVTARRHDFAHLHDQSRHERRYGRAQNEAAPVHRLPHADDRNDQKDDVENVENACPRERRAGFQTGLQVEVGAWIGQPVGVDEGGNHVVQRAVFQLDRRQPVDCRNVSGGRAHPLELVPEQVGNRRRSHCRAEDSAQVLPVVGQQAEDFRHKACEQHDAGDGQHSPQRHHPE